MDGWNGWTRHTGSHVPITGFIITGPDKFPVVIHALQSLLDGI